MTLENQLGPALDQPFDNLSALELDGLRQTGGEVVDGFRDAAYSKVLQSQLTVASSMIRSVCSRRSRLRRAIERGDERRLLGSVPPVSRIVACTNRIDNINGREVNDHCRVH
jgi:hypothetical protein